MGELGDLATVTQPVSVCCVCLCAFCLCLSACVTAGYCRTYYSSCRVWVLTDWLKAEHVVGKYLETVCPAQSEHDMSWLPSRTHTRTHTYKQPNPVQHQFVPINHCSPPPPPSCHLPLPPAGDRDPGAVVRQRDSFPFRFVAWRCVGREVLTKKREVPEDEGEGIGPVVSECVRVCDKLMWRGGGKRTDIEPGTKVDCHHIYRTLGPMTNTPRRPSQDSFLQYNTSRRPSVPDFPGLLACLPACLPGVWISIFYSTLPPPILFHFLSMGRVERPTCQPARSAHASSQMLT